VNDKKSITSILETERLLLREYVEDDAESFYRLNSDPEVLRFTGDDPVVTAEQARTILRNYPMKDYRVHGFGRWACVLRSDGEVIGFAGLKYLPETSEIDLGYRLLPTHWGQGFATEACHAVVGYGFETLKLAEITALVRPENSASVRVLEKCGLTFTEVIQYRGQRVARYAIRPAANTSFESSAL